jgi:hypothetical protein
MCHAAAPGVVCTVQAVAMATAERQRRRVEFLDDEINSKVI